jgi:UDP-N-acetylmuramate--alanine ligase
VSPTLKALSLPEIGILAPDRPIHLAGVGGSAMSGIAAVLVQRGFEVTGTDPSPDEATRARLEAIGIEVVRRQDGSAIPERAQLVIASAALRADHPELEAARARGVPIAKYAMVLGALLNAADGVAIAGTHGKTTTTAMVVCALRAAGLRPGFVVGGHIPQLGASADAGETKVFVAEACEYDRSFLQLEPHRAVITNVDDDHLDVYGDLDGVRRAFAQFVGRVAEGGAVVYCADWPGLAEIAASGQARPVSYSAAGANADWEARDVRIEGGATRFDVYRHGAFALSMSLRIPGRHNVANALAALAVTHDMGLPLPALAAGIAEFGGALRRFQILGEARGVAVVDDYAHHPTEIRALLDGAKERFPGRRLVVVFQPHQIARTRSLFGELAEALARADSVILTDIYAARDTAAAADERSSAPLAEAIRERGGRRVTHAPCLDDAALAALAVLEPGDVLLSVGAGDVHKAGAAVLDALRRA